VRLAALDNVVALKEATGNLTRATELIARCGEQLTLLSGDDATAFPLYAVGARGVISVVSNVAPARMAAMWDAVVAGDWARARALHFGLRALNSLLFAEPSPAPTKACLHLMGRIEPELRSPLYPVSAGLLEQLRAELIHQDLL